MEKQTLILTALPNGFDATGRARLSVFVAPRLWADDPAVRQLSAWPDLAAWPATVAALKWQAAIDGGAPVPLDVEASDLKPALWQALFPGTAQVRPYRFDDYRGIPIESFGASTIAATIAGVYGRASADPAYGAGANRPSLCVLAADPDLVAIARPSFPEPPVEWVDPGLAAVPFPDATPVTEIVPPEPPAPEPEPFKPGCGCGCLFWPLALLGWLLGFDLKPWATGGAAPTGPLPPSSTPIDTPSFNVEVIQPPFVAPIDPPGKTVLPPPLNPAQQLTHDAFKGLNDFLKPFAGNPPPLPDAAQLADEWDVHQALSALGDYPAMLRRLGLVVDVLLPVGQALPAQGAIEVSVPAAVWAAGTAIVAPRTHFSAGAGLFTALPRPVDPEISAGFLRVDDSARFEVIQNDLPGDATKLQNTATHALYFADAADRPPGLPGEGGLPALRTAGISLVRRDAAAELSSQFLRSCAINAFASAIDASPPPPPVDGDVPPLPSGDLYAEDLVRGYRVDVWDKKTKVWRSLGERLGSYEFLDATPAAVTETAIDEGFVQLAATEPGDPAAPRSIRIGETLFTWNGWSLAAPRPSLSILVTEDNPVTDDTPDPYEHGVPDNAAVTPFKVQTRFHAKAGSLPRLRFGREYRLRARVADLAGNSVTHPGDASFAADGPAPTAPFTALRFEPVVPPTIMFHAAPVEGESLERLVVRSPAIGGMGATTARHVAPPQVSQLTAELHGVLDKTGFDGSPASYALSSREVNNLRDDAVQQRPAINGLPGEIPATPAPSDPWVQSANFVTVGYLPDPQARGAGFTDLPGTPAGDVHTLPFTGTWPDLKPFRIELKAIAAGAIPAAPKFTPSVGKGSGVLTVELPEAQRATVRFSSVLDPADLPTRGVWDWTERQAPANLAAVKASIIAGQHWAHLPWRDLTLIHAVQKPLAAPAVVVTSAKSLGESNVVLAGNITSDAASTGRIQLEAAWTDPVDDVTAPAPGTETVQASICEVVIPDGSATTAVIDSATGAPPLLELHDTKFHQAAITPIAVTRFAEYFPASTNTAAATTLAGPAFSTAILNSARPAPPLVRYAVPHFDWDTLPGAAGITERTRTGGLRVYLDRPWYSSGAGELLAAVYLDGQAFPDNADPVAKLVSCWGADPIGRTAPVPGSAGGVNFPGATIVTGLTLAENAAVVAAAGFAPVFDAERKLWFADLSIDAGDGYWPFVRLALARLQPNSLAGAHLSPVHRNDFIALPPRRHAKVAVVGGSIQIDVDGPVASLTEAIATFEPPVGAGASNGLNEIEAVVERLSPGHSPGDPLSWTPVESTRTLIVQDPTAIGSWSGTVPTATGPGTHRVALYEYEWLRTDDLAPAANDRRHERRFARRLVYADNFLL